MDAAKLIIDEEAVELLEPLVEDTGLDPDEIIKCALVAFKQVYYRQKKLFSKGVRRVGDDLIFIDEYGGVMNYAVRN